MKKIPPQNLAAQIELKPDSIKPFENIALAFSGGGFRAASFSLGVLSFLNTVTFDDETDELAGQVLLQQVSYMSSASGGTIATTLYALYSARGNSFGTFYSKLLTQLTGDNLLKDSLKNLAGKKCWDKTSHKSRNIINAFALAYNADLFEGATLQTLYPVDVPTAHLKEVCFNATEFYTGQSFRQHVKLAPDKKPDLSFVYGNADIYLDKAEAEKIRLGDVLAASSCFPAGFEPIVFPEDFTYNGGLTEAELKKAVHMEPQTDDKKETKFIKEAQFGLMDGGITDNQGLQSLMDADKRRLEKQTDFAPFDLMLVNDVGSHFIHPYEIPKVKKDGTLTINSTFGLAGTFLVLFAGLVWFGICKHCTFAVITGSLLAALPIIYVGGMLLIGHLLFGASESSSGVNLQRNFTKKIISLLLKYFTQTPLTVIKQMLAARAESVLMLNTSIFLKRIRQLLYDQFYGSPRWENRGKGNHVYDLSFSNDINRAKSPEPPELNPSHEMQIVAQVAFNMGTTLWFDKQTTEQEHCEACLIACGQFTTCYNLLQYTERLLTKSTTGIYDKKYTKRLQHLKTQLQEHYEHFKMEPFFLYNQSGVGFNVPGFVKITMREIPIPDNSNYSLKPRAKK
ncbi:Patatin-like phospholipase [Mucilaginibacter pineti]|uniref:Patatin-like phospholipase n=1 Tax=Mucilaginibacter pineti TaxID=1391627 RepID=A0A1G7MNT3_9SPHI|nr:patatin-like phospholipase family protein [Mucilaginibacter pineti]SDF63445.1 Patatin-like phospholipase [Mucilaginibacter pineti]